MPEPDRIWAVVEKYKVNVLYTAPTLIRAMMKYGNQYMQTKPLKFYPDDIRK